MWTTTDGGDSWMIVQPVSRIIRCRQLCMMAPDCLSEVVNALALKTSDFIDRQTWERLGRPLP